MLQLKRWGCKIWNQKRKSNQEDQNNFFTEMHYEKIQNAGRKPNISTDLKTLNSKNH